MGFRTITSPLSGLALAALVGCGSFGAQDEVTVDLGDADAYGTTVQPMVRFFCASLDCHGDAQRPLRLYALNGLRIDASLRGDDESPEELMANVLAFASIDPDTEVADSLVLLKPLATFVGGIHHVGKDVWPDRDAAGFRCLEAWLAGDIPGNAAAEAACAAATPNP